MLRSFLRELPRRPRRYKKNKTVSSHDEGTLKSKNGETGEKKKKKRKKTTVWSLLGELLKFVTTRDGMA